MMNMLDNISIKIWKIDSAQYVIEKQLIKLEVGQIGVLSMKNIFVEDAIKKYGIHDAQGRGYGQPIS